MSVLAMTPVVLSVITLAGHPIAQAAVEAGFWDQAHLSRRFKNTVGLSHGRYVAGLAPAAPGC